MVAGVAAYNLITGSLPVSEAAGTPWENTLRSLYYLMRTEADDYLPHVTIPSLYIVAKDDPFGTAIDWQRRAFSGTGGNAELLVIPSYNRAMTAQFVDETSAVISFFKRVL